MICEQELEVSHPLVLYCKSLYEKIHEKIPNKNNIYHVIHPSKIEYYQNHKYITDDSIDEYVTIVKSILISNNFKCDILDNEYIIELHSGSTNENYVISPFGIHKDDYGGIDCQVNTFIIYFDVKCDGGEIAFYEEDNYNIKPYSLDGVYASKRCYKIINTNGPNNKKCKILMFEGELYHRVLKFSNGHRNLLSFQVKKY
jgi:hypothetical protein